MDSTGPFLLPQVVPAGLTPSSPGQPARKAWILVMVDYFTKIAEFTVVEDHTSGASATTSYSHWISRYPRPRKWTTDRGTKNQGHFHAPMERLHIQHVTTAVLYPTANGACERLVGTLKRMIKKLIRDNSIA